MRKIKDNARLVATLMTVIGTMYLFCGIYLLCAAFGSTEGWAPDTLECFSNCIRTFVPVLCFAVLLLLMSIWKESKRLRRKRNYEGYV